MKQRLSRGRKLLQEEFLGFIEGALAKTNPGRNFTLVVLATLPAMTISAQAATLGAAAKGGAAIKGVAFVAFLAAILAPLLSFYGMWADYRMKRKAGHPVRELKLLKVHYFGIAGIVASFVLVTCALMSKAGSLIKTNPALFAVLMIGSILGYALLIVAFSIWVYRGGKKLPAELTPGEIATKPKNPSWEYRSRFELLGLPFIHIRFWGCFGARMKDSSMWKPVKAWIAVTDSFAFGVLFAYGGVAIAPISLGAVGIGLFSWGGMAIGALALGGFGFGIWALAPFAVGWQSFGDVAIAWNAAWGGKFAVAHHFALAETAHAAQANTEFVADLLFANPFFQFCRMKWSMTYMLLSVWAWAIPMMISQIVQRRMSRKRLHRRSIDS